ncbi:MAG: hypothetical protein [Caudoviricetes sp.]|nr:MAG: hypothetical protein [Caudoviricetes sp.]
MESYYVVSTAIGDLKFEKVTTYIKVNRHNNNLEVYSKLSDKLIKVINSNSWISIETCLL